MSHLLPSLGALCLIAASASGEAREVGLKVYYVAPGGEDRNPGSLSEPWRTIRKANEALRPGDTVYVRGGVYEEQSPGNAIIVPKYSGAPGKYITYAAYKDEIPFINAPEGQMVLSAIDLRGKSYIRVDGFRLGGPMPGKKWSGVKFWVNMRGTRMKGLASRGWLTHD